MGCLVFELGRKSLSLARCVCPYRTKRYQPQGIGEDPAVALPTLVASIVDEGLIAPRLADTPLDTRGGALSDAAAEPPRVAAYRCAAPYTYRRVCCCVFL